MTAPSSPPGLFGATMADDENAIALVESLRFAVPLAILELESAHPGGVPLSKLLLDSARIGTYSDCLLFAPGFRGQTRGSQRTAANLNNYTLAHNGLVRGLAALAIMTPGGLTYAGVHFCAAPHDGCPFDAQPVREPVTDEDKAYVTRLLDELEAQCIRAGRPRRRVARVEATERTPTRRAKQKSGRAATGRRDTQGIVPVGGIL